MRRNEVHRSTVSVRDEQEKGVTVPERINALSFCEFWSGVDIVQADVYGFGTDRGDVEKKHGVVLSFVVVWALVTGYPTRSGFTGQ